MAYVLAGVLGGLTRGPFTELAPVWPAAGVAYLWFLRTGLLERGAQAVRQRLTGGVMLLGASAAANIATGAPVQLGVVLGGINVVEVSTDVVVWRLVDGRMPAQLRDLRGLAAVAAGAGAGAAVTGPLAGVAVAFLADESLGPATVYWVVQDAVSGTVIVSAGLALLTPEKLRRGVWWEAAAFFGASGCLHWLVFRSPAGHTFGYAVLPAVVWAGLRLGVRVSAVHAVLSGAAVTACTIVGWGPYGGVEPVSARATIAQGFVAVVSAIGLVLSISQCERARAARRAAADQEMLTQTVHGALIANAVILLDPDGGGRVVLANPAMGALLDAPAAALRGRPLVELLTGPDTAALRRVLRQLWLRVTDTWQGQVQYQDGEGRTHWCQAAIARMGRADNGEGGADPHRPSAPVPSGSAVVQLLDVTHQQQLQARLTHMAMHDQLTGLPNRNLLQDRVDHALSAATRSGALVALLFFDIDDFKTVNDSLGHPAGDRVLKALAERISAAVRPDDTVARIGGDEFVVCCSAVDSREHAFEIAQRVKAAAAEPIELEERTIRVSVSGGITLSTPDSSVTDLLRESDSAMYEAKRAGGSHVTLFASALQRRAQRHLDVEHELRQAVERDQLVMHYQPIVDLVTESTVALEALIRWQHPERGLLLPGAWLDVAESSGLMHEIGAWALAETSRFGAVLADELRSPLALHVNVSARQLLEPDFAAVVKEALRHSGMAATRLVVELTETHLMSIGERLVSELHELQVSGVRLAADDFGTGYSSLTQLTVLPIDELKIDKSFVLAMGQDTRALAVVHGILGMATAMGLDVVAEGVETRAAAETLRDLGCPHAQGFLWGAAGSAADVLTSLRARPGVGEGLS